nr:hypothetical protein [Tolivirales sp.]
MPTTTVVKTSKIPISGRMNKMKNATSTQVTTKVIKQKPPKERQQPQKIPRWVQCATTPAIVGGSPSGLPDGTTGYLLPVDHHVTITVKPDSTGRIVGGMIPGLPGGLYILHGIVEVPTIDGLNLIYNSDFVMSGGGSPPTLPNHQLFSGGVIIPWNEYRSSSNGTVDSNNPYKARMVRTTAMGMTVSCDASSLTNQGRIVSAHIQSRPISCCAPVLSRWNYRSTNTTTDWITALVTPCQSLPTEFSDIAGIKGALPRALKSGTQMVSYSATGEYNWAPYEDGACCPVPSVEGSTWPASYSTCVGPYYINSPYHVGAGNYGIELKTNGAPASIHQNYWPVPLIQAGDPLVHDVFDVAMAPTNYISQDFLPMVFAANGVDAAATLTITAKLCVEYQVSWRSEVRNFTIPSPPSNPMALAAVKAVTEKMPSSVPFTGEPVNFWTRLGRGIKSLAGAGIPWVSGIAGAATAFFE